MKWKEKHNQDRQTSEHRTNTCLIPFLKLKLKPVALIITLTKRKCFIHLAVFSVLCDVFHNGVGSFWESRSFHPSNLQGVRWWEIGE